MTQYLEDHRVRLEAFNWLEAQVRLYGDVLPRELLQKGFELEGNRIPLVAPQGIFKPKVLAELPLSITTTTKSPYDDKLSPEGFILYSYRGEDPQHHENVRLRKAMMSKVPLVYFHGIIPGKYMATWPVYIVGDDPQALKFKVAADDQIFLYTHSERSDLILSDSGNARRSYITSMVKQRLHQRSFRERVLAAYQEQCAFCKLRHKELLDAAHIIPDIDPFGEPVVSNGLALCKLHHAAFDSFFLSVRPDYTIEIRSDVLEEDDGPMLIHGLQGLHNRHIVLPKLNRARPNIELLKRRYEDFLKFKSKLAF